MKKKLCEYSTKHRLPSKVTFNNQQFVCTKINRLCDTVEMRFLELLSNDYPQRVFDYSELSALTASMTMNGRRIQNQIKNFKLRVPMNFFEFENQLKEIHQILFQNTSLLDIGQFRTVDVWVDKNDHTFMGSDSNNITAHLKFVWANYFETFCIKVSTGQTIHKMELVKFAANFLSFFFRIHPFRDGNGRVGRSFVWNVIYNATFDMTFKPAASKSKGRFNRRYLKALRYSHKRFKNNGCEILKFIGSKDLDKMSHHLFNFLNDLVTKREPAVSVETEPDGTQVLVASLYRVIRKTPFK